MSLRLENTIEQTSCVPGSEQVVPQILRVSQDEQQCQMSKLKILKGSLDPRAEMESINIRTSSFQFGDTSLHAVAARWVIRLFPTLLAQAATGTPMPKIRISQGLGYVYSASLGRDSRCNGRSNNSLCRYLLGSFSRGP